MAYVDMTFQEFVARFGTEEACLQAIFEARWPRGFICPYCGHNDGNRISTRRSMQCCLCRRQSSITSGTVFSRSQTRLTLWFLIIYEMAHDKGGASVERIRKRLGMHYGTVRDIVQKIRVAMGSRDEDVTLAGYIELDEAFFGGRNKKPGPKSPRDNKVEVLVMVESEGTQAGNLVMQVIESDRIEDIGSVVAQKVESEPPGQWFRSDGLGRHHVVMSYGHKITMTPVPKSLQDDVLRCVNLAISHAKRFFKGTYHHFCKTHIQKYLDEFCYRWNRRHLEKQLASHLIAACALHKPVARTLLLPMAA